MVGEELKATLKDASLNKQEIIDKMCEFAQTDVLLFWNDNPELASRQNEFWFPVLRWIGQELNIQLKTSTSIDVPDQEEKFGVALKRYLEKFSDKELIAFYKAALDMRSVMLAAALVKGKIDAEQAFQAAYLEELWQAEKWGKVEDAEKSRERAKADLVEIEKFLKTK